MIAPTQVGSVAMIRSGRQIRLTRAEVERFVLITDIDPEPVRSMEDLDDYVTRCKRHYWGISDQTRFLHWLIDREYQRCVDTTRPLEVN